jgi:polyhydroxyalkanoate synthase
MTAYRGRTFGQVYHRMLGDSLTVGQATLGTRTVSVADVAQPLLVLAGATDQIAPLAAVKAGVSLAAGSHDARFEIVPGGHLGMLTGREARTGSWRVLDSWVEEWADLPAATRRRTPTKAAATRTPPGKAAAKRATAKRTAVKKAAAQKTAARKAAAPKAAAAQTPATKAPAKKVSAKKEPAKKASAKKAPAKKVSAKKASAKKAPAKKGAAGTTSEPVIGANTSRRYGSAGSRALRRPTR